MITSAVIGTRNLVLNLLNAHCSVWRFALKKLRPCTNSLVIEDPIHPFDLSPFYPPELREMAWR